MFLTLEHGCPGFPPDRELSLGESVVRLTPRSDGFVTCDFNVPKIHQGHNATLLSIEQDLQTIDRVIQAVSVLHPIYDQPLEKWRVKSLELSENRRVESSDQFMHSLAMQSVTAKNGGHRNHGYHPSVYFGPKCRTSRFYGKEPECGRIEGVDLTGIIRHEISMRGDSIKKQIETRSIRNLCAWLKTESPVVQLTESWDKYAQAATILDPTPIVDHFYRNHPISEAEKLVTFFLTRQAYGPIRAMKLLRLKTGTFYRRKKAVDEVLAKLSA